MREGLKHIETIERYLEGKLSGEELSAFESKLKTDSALQQEVQSQKMVVNRVNKIGRVNALNKAHTGFEKKMIMRKWIKAGVISASVAVAAIAGATTLNDESNNAISNPEKAIVAADSDNEKKAKQTPVYQDTTKKESEKSSKTSVEDEEDPSFTTESENKSENDKNEVTKNTSETETKKNKKEAVDHPKKEKKTEPTPSTKDEGKKVTKKGAEISKHQEEGFRKKGTKMYIWTNDANAKKHLIRELQKYNTWKVSYTKEKADYQINLYEEKILLDRMVWIEIVNMETDEILYSSPRAKGLDSGIKTVNLKQQAVYNLVHDVLRFEFFMEKEKEEPKGTRI